MLPNEGGFFFCHIRGVWEDEGYKGEVDKEIDR